MMEADPEGENGSREISFERFSQIVGVGHPNCLDSVFDYIDSVISTEVPDGSINPPTTRILHDAFGTNPQFKTMHD